MLFHLGELELKALASLQEEARSVGLAKWRRSTVRSCTALLGSAVLCCVGLRNVHRQTDRPWGHVWPGLVRSSSAARQGELLSSPTVSLFRLPHLRLKDRAVYGTAEAWSPQQLRPPPPVSTVRMERIIINIKPC